MFKGLEHAEIWNTCLKLAIEGFNSGSMGIAALVTDESGRIVGAGRNRLGEQTGDGLTISNSSIAHAEINAIHSLQKESLEGAGLRIFTTVEPCPMCLGAIAMSRIRSIFIGSADPHAGSVKHLNANDYVRLKNIQCYFEAGLVEDVFFTIHYLSILRVMKDRKPHVVFDNLMKRYGDKIRRIESRIDSNTVDRLRLNVKQIAALVK